MHRLQINYTKIAHSRVHNFPDRSNITGSSHGSSDLLGVPTFSLQPAGSGRSQARPLSPGLTTHIWNRLSDPNASPEPFYGSLIVSSAILPFHD